MQTAKAEVKDLHKKGFPQESKYPPIKIKYNLTINDRLKAARNRTGMSASMVIKGLARRGIKMGHSTLQGYEADEASLNHRYPSVHVLKNLVDFYGCSMDYIFGYSDRMDVQKPEKKIDIKDTFESRTAIMYNGIKLTKKQRDLVTDFLDEVLAENG